MNKKVLMMSIIAMAFIALLFLGNQGVLDKKNVAPLESDVYNDMEIIEITASTTAEMENVNVLPSDDVLRANCADYAKGDGITKDNLPVYMNECIEDLKDQYLDGETPNREDEEIDDEVIIPSHKTP